MEYFIVCPVLVVSLVIFPPLVIVQIIWQLKIYQCSWNFEPKNHHNKSFLLRVTLIIFVSYRLLFIDCFCWYTSIDLQIFLR